MDDQLKQRLWGATIVVALAVIFVPMLFDKQGEERGAISENNVPPLPPEAQEREIALPAMPDEALKTEPAAGEVQPRERPAYRIIPLDDTPAAKSDGKPIPEQAQDTPAPAGSPTEFEADEGGAPDQLPTRDSPLAKLPRTGGKAKDAPTLRSEVAAPKPAPPSTGAPLPREAPATKRPVTPPAKAPARQPLSMETRPPPAVQDSPPKSVPARKDASGDAASARTAKPDAKVKAEDSKPSVRPPAPAKPPARESAEVARPARPEAGREKPPESPAEASPTKKPETIASAAPTPASTAKPATSSSAKPARDGKSAAPAANKPKTAAAPSTWVVRAATYNSEASAKALAEKLKKQQFPAYVQKVTTERGTIYRVQVGPASDKTRAEATRKRLESSAGVRGALVAR